MMTLLPCIVLYIHMATKDLTVNQHYYIVILNVLCERVEESSTPFLKKSRMLDEIVNAADHSTLCDNVWSAKHGIMCPIIYLFFPNIRLEVQVQYLSTEAVRDKAINLFI